MSVSMRAHKRNLIFECIHMSIGVAGSIVVRGRNAFNVIRETCQIFVGTISIRGFQNAMVKRRLNFKNPTKGFKMNCVHFCVWDGERRALSMAYVRMDSTMER